MQNKTIIIITALLLLLIITVSSSLWLEGCTPVYTDNEQFGPEERIVIKFSHVTAEDSPKGQAANLFAQLVAEKTAGKVEVQVYPNSTLYMDGEEVDALREGRIQMIAPATAKMTDFFKPLLLFDLPYLFENYQDVHAFLDSPTGQEMLAGINSQEMLGLAMWDNGFKQITANRPVIYPGDFTGLRIRIMPSPVLEEQFKTLNAHPVAYPFSEVYSTLESGRVDGGENTASNIYTKGFHLVQSNMTISNHGFLGYIVLVNKNFWEQLPADIRRAIKESMDEVTTRQRAIAQEQNQIHLQIISDSGEIIIHTQTAEERAQWKRVLEPLYDDFRSSIGPSLLQEAQELSRLN